MVTAIIAAAGQGKRMGGGINKVFIPLLGRSLLARTVQTMASCPDVDRLVVVAAGEEIGQVKEIISGLDIDKEWQVVKGGSERQYSIANALQHVPVDTSIVLVHDAARPLISHGLIAKLVDTARRQGAAIAAVPVKDTIKTVDEDGIVAGTPERSKLWAVQTPQAFRASLLHEAYNRAAKEGIIATDDAALVERLGVKVKVVRGEYCNIKITTPEDIIIAEAFFGAEEKVGKMQRLGIGYDVHRLVEERKLILGGVEIPYSHGLEGHSDADVLLHAIKDALLGAAAMGDIGRHFPDTDMRYKGVSSLGLLAAVRKKLKEAGYGIVNVDATIVAQRPKLAPYIEQMKTNIANTLDVAAEQVNIKATTTEGLGFAGRREGIAAYAVASIFRS